MTPGVALQNGTSYGLESRRSSSVLLDRVWLCTVFWLKREDLVDYQTPELGN
jgi:hypothetical protein